MSDSVSERFAALATPATPDWVDVRRRARRHRRPRRLVVVAAAAALLLGVVAPALAIAFDALDDALDVILAEDRQQPSPQPLSLVIAMPYSGHGEARIRGRVNSESIVHVELQFLGDEPTLLPLDAERRFSFRVAAERLRDHPAMITGFNARGEEFVSLLVPPLDVPPPPRDIHDRRTE